MTTRLIIASSETCADLFWATRFFVPDPIIYLEHKGRKILVASDLELGRARKEAAVDEVLSSSVCERRLKLSGRKRREGDVLDLILKEKKIRILKVPSYFPIRQAEVLRKRGYRIASVPDPFFPEREVKSNREKRFIVETLRTTEAGIAAAIALLRGSKIRKGSIYHNGSPLTSGELRRRIEITMMERGSIGQHTIVAGGRQAADPHCVGFGPLRAHQPIVLDVFPRSVATGYHGDITRTVVKGCASEGLRKMYTAVKKAQEKGIRTVRAGIDGAKVHAAVCETLRNEGFKTETIGGKPQGFIHSTGHGLGLDIHELPRISQASMRLKKGAVVTVEPGLYYDHLGGIRIEDVVYVTQSGCEVLTRLPKVLEIP